MKIKDLFKENGILSGKRVLAAVVTGTVLIGTTLGVSASGHEWGSKGNVVYQNNTTGARTTIFDKSDLEYLDERIDAIENNVITGKESIANELNTKGTNDGTLSGSSTFSELANGVVNSQKIPGEGEPFLLDGQQVYKLPSGEITTDGTKENAEPLNIVAANENNLSAGTAAWVDGTLLIGTGADNNSYYNIGESNTGKIYIPYISFELSHSGRSDVSRDSSVGSNIISGTSSSTTKFMFCVKGLTELSVESGSCTYLLKDPDDNSIQKSGILTNLSPVDIRGYQIIELSCDISYNGSNYGTHDSSLSGTNSSTITGLRIE